MMHPKQSSIVVATWLALLASGVASGCTETPTLAPAAPSTTPEAERKSDPARTHRATTQLSASPRVGFVPASRRLGARLVQPLDKTARPEPSAHVHAGTPTEAGFLGRPERALLERMRTSEITGVEKGTSGRTLAFRLTLAADDGTVVEGYFKPEQRTPSANWYAEVAAFYLDRALGLGRVPPVVSRRVPWARLEPAAAGDGRARKVVVGRDGQVRGALILWLPEKLVPAATPPGWETWLRNEPWSPVTVTPYQDAAAYRQAIVEQRRRQARREPLTPYYQEPPADPRTELPAELSDMIVFDFLSLNYDRFGGDNTNVRTLGERGPLIFLDNGGAFSRGPARGSLLDRRLEAVSRFRRRTIDALRGLDLVPLKANLASDALGPILDAAMLRGLEQRRATVLAHVAERQQRFGDAVYAW